jgi:tetratricopeptide (TPR) repeat protein
MAVVGNRREAARQHQTRAGAFPPGTATRTDARGAVAGVRCKFEIARTLFKESITRSPNHAQSYQAWACLEAKQGNLAQAKTLAWKGIKQAPEHPALWTIAGVVETRLGNTERAKKIFKEAISRFPKHGALYKVLGELYAREGAFQKARLVFNAGLDQDPRYSPVYQAAALLEAKLGNLERLSSLHKKAKEFFQSDKKEQNNSKDLTVNSTGRIVSSDGHEFDLTLDGVEHQASREKEITQIMDKIKSLETEYRKNKEIDAENGRPVNMQSLIESFGSDDEDTFLLDLPEME